MVREVTSYGISLDTGCLREHDGFVRHLPKEFLSARNLALDLPHILPTGRVRQIIESTLEDATESEALRVSSDEDARAALLHYLFLAQAFVWGEDNLVDVLPNYLAVPICSLAKRLKQPPIITYRNYVLENWSRINSAGKVELGNMRIPQQFLGGLDEHWFIAVHVAIEAAAAPAYPIIKNLLDACRASDESYVREGLDKLIDILAEINLIFKRMPEGCDPQTYFIRVRPYIHGWKNNAQLPNGLVYEGVEEFAGKPQQYRGETGAQSAMVPIFDAVFGVGHAINDGLRPYLDDLHLYRPEGHRAFIDEIEQQAGLRRFAKSAGENTRRAYNMCVMEIAEFRRQHLDYARIYVFEQAEKAGMSSSDIGTGGTPFARYLGKHHKETSDILL